MYINCSFGPSSVHSFHSWPLGVGTSGNHIKSNAVSGLSTFALLHNRHQGRFCSKRKYTEISRNSNPFRRSPNIRISIKESTVTNIQKGIEYDKHRWKLGEFNGTVLHLNVVQSDGAIKWYASVNVKELRKTYKKLIRNTY